MQVVQIAKICVCYKDVFWGIFRLVYVTAYSCVFIQQVYCPKITALRRTSFLTTIYGLYFNHHFILQLQVMLGLCVAIISVLDHSATMAEKSTFTLLLCKITSHLVFTHQNFKSLEQVVIPQLKVFR